ncbi:MAG: hypothetical protein ACFCD0_14365, partial [Gemmataceae bacterium]
SPQGARDPGLGWQPTELFGYSAQQVAWFRFSAPKGREILAVGVNPRNSSGIRLNKCRGFDSQPRRGERSWPWV